MTDRAKLEAARSRGFPEALREQIAAWDQLRSGCRSAHDLIRDVHAWLASQPLAVESGISAALDGHAYRALVDLCATILGCDSNGHAVVSEIRSIRDLADLREQERDGESARVRHLGHETEALRADIRELQRNALPSNCTRCNGVGAEPPGCPESGPCERCGGWTSHKRLVAGEAEALRARVRELEAERGEIVAAVASFSPERTKGQSLVNSIRTIATDLETTLAYVPKITAERDSARAKAIEEAAIVASTMERHCQLASFTDGRTYDLLDRDEVVRAIRALATRGGAQ